ncbi:hypothetical protein AALB39_26880 [Lachnospiraceae bacterium 54-53]
MILGVILIILGTISISIGFLFAIILLAGKVVQGEDIIITITAVFMIVGVLLIFVSQKAIRKSKSIRKSKLNTLLAQETLRNKIKLTTDSDSLEPLENEEYPRNHVEDILGTHIPSNSSYIQTTNAIYRADGKEITDKEVPYLIQIGIENALQEEKEYKQGIHNIFQNHTFNADETLFFSELTKQLEMNRLKPSLLKLHKLSNGTWNVDYISECYVGKIRLSGKTNYMQYSRGMTSIKELMNPTLDECISNIPKWIRYIKYCKHNR